MIDPDNNPVYTSQMVDSAIEGASPGPFSVAMLSSGIPWPDDFSEMLTSLTKGEISKEEVEDHADENLVGFLMFPEDTEPTPE